SFAVKVSIVGAAEAAAASAVAGAGFSDLQLMRPARSTTAPVTERIDIIFLTGSKDGKPPPQGTSEGLRCLAMDVLSLPHRVVLVLVPGHFLTQPFQLLALRRVGLGILFEQPLHLLHGIPILLLGLDLWWRGVGHGNLLETVANLLKSLWSSG